jgi:hypothetical protein
MSMYCYCTQCFPSKKRASKTIAKHLNYDIDLLNDSDLDHSQEFHDHLQDCIDRTTTSLASENASNDCE